MAWDSKYPAFGVIKIDGKKVHLYSTRDRYTTITCDRPVVNAMWAGSFLNVTLDSKKVRRYSSRDSYNLI